MQPGYSRGPYQKGRYVERLQLKRREGGTPLTQDEIESSLRLLASWIARALKEGASKQTPPSEP